MLTIFVNITGKIAPRMRQLPPSRLKKARSEGIRYLCIYLWSIVCKRQQFLCKDYNTKFLSVRRNEVTRHCVVDDIHEDIVNNTVMVHKQSVVGESSVRKALDK